MTLVAEERDLTRGHLRGSSLLLAGRLLSTGLNFVTQVVTVAFLAKAEYGAYAYALSILFMAQTLATAGLNRAIARFLPIYEERADDRRLFGTLIFALGSVLALGLGIILLAYGLEGWLGRTWVRDPRALALILILIVAAPAEALDALLERLFAIFVGPRAIFFRRHVLEPGLKLAVVLGVIYLHGDALLLARGYVVVTGLAVAGYAVALARALWRRGLLQRCDLRAVRVPSWEILSFTLPLLTTDTLHIVRGVLDAVLLEHFRGTAEVAAFRAVQPTARLNQIVYTTFSMLFIPAAARFFARGDGAGMSRHYWQSTVWIAVLSFPIFAVTFSLSQPVTALLYGTRYESSASILALLSFGYYFNAVLGFNVYTLRVYGAVRRLVLCDLVAAGLNVGLNLLLIPRHGAAGAAVSAMVSLVAYNVLLQAGLWSGTGVRGFESQYARVYLSIAAASLGLLLAQWAFAPPAPIGLFLAGVVSLIVLRNSRAVLAVENTFPEIGRFPLARRLLGGAR